MFAKLCLWSTIPNLYPFFNRTEGKRNASALCIYYPRYERSLKFRVHPVAKLFSCWCKLLLCSKADLWPCLFCTGYLSQYNASRLLSFLFFLSCVVYPQQCQAPLSRALLDIRYAVLSRCNYVEKRACHIVRSFRMILVEIVLPCQPS